MKVKSIKIKEFFLDVPDVDCDFPPEARDKVKEYIANKYGVDYSCSVATYTRIKLKTAIKDFGKVKGLSFDLTNKITKDIDDQIEYTWGDLIEFASRSKSLYKFVQDNPEIVHLTKYALMIPKAESVHPSAYIIVPKQNGDGEKTDIFNLMPIKEIDGLLVTEWEGKYTEGALFLKEDILGLSQLTKIHNTIKLIKKHYNVDIDVTKIPFDDKEVFKFFKRGWCEDVFQFGTTGLMGYCRQVKPSQLSDLIAMTALFRPGPMESNAHQDFADIKNGKKKPKYDYGIQNITEETYSLLVYQEQMMSIIHQLGGLSLIDAENARKYIKKKKHKELSELGDRFIAGAISNGCPEKEAKKIWDKMNAFSSYSFNKCIAGSESFYKVGYKSDAYRPTIGEMYRIAHDYKYAKETGHLALRSKYRSEGYGSCFSLLGKSRAKRNKIVDITYQGMRNVYEVTTKSGNSIRVTMNHKFPQLDGVDKMLAELKVGDKIPVLWGYQERTPGVKYDFGTGGSGNYPKAGECGFREKEFAVSRFFDEWCEERKRNNEPCWECGKEHQRMEAHHIDGNHANNDESNLTWLCPSCHKKAHYRDLGRKKMGEKGLICYWSEITAIELVGEEDVYDVEVSGDVSHTFLTSGGVITNNSHAAAYSYISYWSMWLKVNYPLEFWTVSLSESKESEIPYRLAEMKKAGVEVEVRPPDVNYSSDYFTCDDKEQRIFFSLNKIKGVGDVAVKAIIDERNKNGEFFEFEEFLDRVPSKVNKTVVKALIIGGAFDLLCKLNQPRDRKKLLEKYLLEIKGDKELPEPYNSGDSTTNAFWIQEQKRLTGFGEIDYENYIRDLIPNKRFVRLYVDENEFQRVPEKKEVVLAGKFLFYRENNTKNGVMGTIQLDCNNTIINCTIWPDIYNMYREEIEDYKGRIIALSGTVQKDKFRNERRLFSNDRTRIYVVSETKTKLNRMQEKHQRVKH